MNYLKTFEGHSSEVSRLDAYQSELSEYNDELKKLCGYKNHSHFTEEINHLIKKVRKLHIKINQEKQKSR